MHCGYGSILTHTPNLLLAKTKYFCMAECCVWLDCQSAAGDLAKIHPAQGIGRVLSDSLGIHQHSRLPRVVVILNNCGYLLTIVAYAIGPNLYALVSLTILAVGIWPNWST